MIDSKSILDFWFVQSTPNMWFKKSENFDELLRTKFNKTIEICLKVKIDEILISSDSYLSNIIVLDQFTRNVFRNNPKAFEGDKTALESIGLELLQRYQFDGDINDMSFRYRLFTWYNVTIKDPSRVGVALTF